MHFLALLLALFVAAPIPSVYIILGVIVLLIIAAVIYFYTKLWQNRKEKDEPQAHDRR